jgi:hypothetical protein
VTDAPTPLDAHSSARLLARWVAVERRLFELTGSLAAESDDDEVVVVLGAESGHHAWRAEQLASLLPLLATTGPTGWLDEATAAAADLFDPLEADLVGAARLGADPAAALLSVVHRAIVPELRREWAERIMQCGPATDAAVERMLRLVDVDAALDLARAEPVLDRLDAANSADSGAAVP